ncbi:TonB-dependent receptor [Zoogloea sp.]|uniref:TonB-dependent receptor n=1 Tax=Zoogloea sp. TaxID=49181 RepID=UPI0035B0C8CA
MSKHRIPRRHDPARINSRHRGFRLSPIAALFAGMTLFSALPVNAQSLSDVQAENKRLAAENERLRQALEQQKQQATGSAATARPTAAASVVEATTTPPIPLAPNKGDALLLEAVSVKNTKLKEIPKSVSVITGEELEKFHVNNFRDIVNRIGNVRTSWQNPNTASIFIRGVGWAAGAGVLEPSVGVNVDGVSYGISSITALGNFLDIESVDVTRGPTGVDGGRASNVGRVSINTRKPSFVPEARASVTYGERNTAIATAVIGGAIQENVLAYRLTVNRETAEGPYDNKNDSHYSWRNTDRTNIRSQFLLTPNKDLEARLSLDFTPKGREICENCFAFRLKTPANYDRLNSAGQPIPVNYAEDNFGKISRRWFGQKTDYTVADYYAKEINTLGEYPNTYATKGVTADVKYKLNDAHTLTFITGYRDYDFSQGAGTHTQFEWLRAPRGTQTEYKQLSQEIRLDSKLTDTLRYQGGLYFFQSQFPNTSQTERYGSDGGAWYANAAQYALLDPVNPLLPNATDSAGRALLLNSLDGLITKVRNRIDNKSQAAYSNLIWDATKELSLSAGLRLSRESRKTSGSSYIESNGFGAELNPASVNNVQLNGFANNANGVLAASNNAAQLALADLVAQKYFGVATYGALSADQKKQVAAAKAIRAGRIGALYQNTIAQSYLETLPTIELGSTYRFNNAHTGFATWKHGEKAGVSQIVGGTVLGGKSVPADTEKTDAYEVGLKSFFLNKTLSVTSALFLQNIRNYIQPVYVFDEVQTRLNNNGLPAYLSALGNVPKVQTKGLELDVVYSGLPYTTLRFAGAYTDARYKDFKFAANPGELGGDPNQPYFDASGKTLAGAPKFSGNLFGDFSYPILGNKVFHTNLNYNFQSSYYADPTLSRYSKTKSFGVADLAIGVGRQDNKFDVSFVVKNLFNEDTSLQPSWNSYKPGIPRWFGVTISASLY